MMLFGLFCLLSMRMILSVAIVAMTKTNNITLDDGTVVEEQEFEWNSKQQGLILSSFFYGYMATQLFTGFLSARFGGHVESPKNDPFITEIEKTYILSSIGENIFNYNLDTTGILSSIPYIALASLLSVAGYFADWLQVKGYLTTEQVRRYFNSVTFTIQMIFMILVAFSTNPILTVVYLTLAVGVDAFPWSGYAINALDLAPSHAAIIKAIGITFGGFGGVLSSHLVGYIVTDKSREQWQIVFFITAGIYLFGAVVSWYFVKGSIQPWARIDLEDMKKRNEQTDIKSF
ncbi:uncharacterized transporter slc-17.2-like [Lutzomyia longipalpis]|uniref:uncharacterized transporter slc-17.2-like n=1 Tax=Lutzomyia longipalpis TaxID=7200 RepID=UPI00248376F1|nr:uncharacterized transporter slc-17.2-like [Lutzomyia longipalpis]